MMPDAMTTNNDLVNAFLAYLRAERGASEHTPVGLARISCF